MRIATLGIHHETNTYSPVAADHAQCLADGIERGDEIIETYQNAQSTLTGFIDDASKTYGFELVPLIFAHTGPIGTITKDAFDRIAGEMIALLEANGPWDGVLLANHGAAVSEEYPDVDGEIARRVRVLVGQKVPTGKALDLHGNLSPAMVDHTDAIVFYRTNPHLDARPLALECAEIIVRTIKGEVKPIQTLEMPSLVINIIKQFIGEEPMQSLMANCEELIWRPGILSASVVEGYPYADVIEMGAAFLVIADGNPILARESARWLARRAWDRRTEFVGGVPSATEALQMAVAEPQGQRI